jgi:hypothetical protein
MDAFQNCFGKNVLKIPPKRRCEPLAPHLGKTLYRIDYYGAQDNLTSALQGDITLLKHRLKGAEAKTNCAVKEITLLKQRLTVLLKKSHC